MTVEWRADDLKEPLTFNGRVTMTKRAFRWAIPLATAACFLASVSTGAAQSSRARQAAAEPEIQAVRAIYQEVMQAVAANRLARRDTTVQCDGDDWGQTVTFRTDAAGRVRLLTWEGGTDDHAETHRFYYDGAGRLRFIFATYGAVNGTLLEERVYYATNGRLLRRLRTQTHGPGYSFVPPTPIWRPAEWLRRLCSGSRGGEGFVPPPVRAPPDGQSALL
ncbi:MAG TPA: hypothetical protein VF092_19020 [Longimicrobium sp.]